VTNGSWPNHTWYWNNSRLLNQFRKNATRYPPPFMEDILNSGLDYIFNKNFSIAAKYGILQLCIWDKVRGS